jgi:hypothetical protein
VIKTILQSLSKEALTVSEEDTKSSREKNWIAMMQREAKKYLIALTCLEILLIVRCRTSPTHEIFLLWYGRFLA